MPATHARGGTITIATRNAPAGPDNPLGLPAGDYVVLAVKDKAAAFRPKSWSR
jgi:hypothetical protein